MKGKQIYTHFTVTYTLHIYKIHSYNTSKYKAGIKLFDTKKSFYFKKG